MSAIPRFADATVPVALPPNCGCHPFGDRNWSWCEAHSPKGPALEVRLTDCEPVRVAMEAATARIKELKAENQALRLHAEAARDPNTPHEHCGCWGRATSEARHYEQVAQKLTNENEDYRARFKHLAEEGYVVHAKRRFRLELVSRREDIPGRPYEFEAENGRKVYVVPFKAPAHEWPSMEQEARLRRELGLPGNVALVFMDSLAEFGPVFELVPDQALDTVGR